MNLINTEFIVLRKTQYQESSLIISTLSKECGKIDFIIKGAKRIGKRSFAVVDLFRELKGDFQLRDNGLSKLSSPELVSSFDTIVNSSENYLLACAIAKFVTGNTHPNVSMPMLYMSLKNALVELALSNAINVPWLTLLKIVFLHEQGLMPSILSGNGSRENEEEKQTLLNDIIEFACGKKNIVLTTEYWGQLTEWVNSLCDYNGIKY